MKKLTQMILPLALAIASSVALAEGGSDYALSSVPSTQAPAMVSQLAYQNPHFVRTAIASTPRNVDNQHMKGGMKMGMMSDMQQKMNR
ncbi:MAG: hypothetical protein R6V43_01725 [Halopseudomonas sp.]